LKEKQVKRIILTRPAVEAGKFSFYPDIKLDPILQTVYDALRDMLSNEKLEDYILCWDHSIATLRHSW
jgi:phosphate starvation-inducible PhoH-like protein